MTQEMRLDSAGVVRLAARHREVAAAVEECAGRLRQPTGEPMLDRLLSQLCDRLTECGAGLDGLAAAMEARSAELADTDSRGTR